MKNTILTLIIAAIALAEATYIFTTRNNLKSKLEDKTLNVTSNGLKGNEFDKVLIQMDEGKKIEFLNLSDYYSINIEHIDTDSGTTRVDIDTMQHKIKIGGTDLDTMMKVYIPKNLKIQEAYIRTKETTVEKGIFILSEENDIASDITYSGVRTIALKNGKSITSSTFNRYEAFFSKGMVVLSAPDQ